MAAPMLLTEKQAEGLNRLREENDNLRAVLGWAIDAIRSLAADIAVPLWRYWQMRGQLAEGRQVLDRLLDRLTPTTTPPRGGRPVRTRRISYWQLDVPAMTAAYAEAAQLYEKLGRTGRPCGGAVQPGVSRGAIT